MRTLTRIAVTVAFAVAAHHVLAQSELQTLYMVVADRTAQKLIRFDPVTGAYLDSFGQDLGSMEAVTFGPDQNLYVSLNIGFTQRVDRHNGSTGQRMDTFVHRGSLMAPSGLTFGPDGHLYVSDHMADEIDRFDGLTGERIDTFIAREAGGLDGPVELLFRGDRMVYVTSQRSHRVLRFAAINGTFVDEFVGAGSGALCPDPDGNDPKPEGDGGLCGPYGLVIGPDDNLYVTSTLNGKILRYDGLTGDFMDEFVSGLTLPTGMAFHQGSLYVTTQIDDQPGVYRFDAETGAAQGLFAWQEIEGPHDVLFYTWESQLSATGNESAVSAHGSGQRVVVWTDSDADGSGIWVQRYDRDGRSQGSKTRVNQSTAGDQHSASIDHSADGFVVVWISETGTKIGSWGERLLGRFYDPDGEPRGGEFVISDGEGGLVSSPEVDLGGDQAVVVWLWRQSPPKQTPEGDAVMAMLIGSDGEPRSDRIVVDRPSAGGVSQPATVWTAGRPLVVWDRHSTKSFGAGVRQEEDGIVGVFLGDDGEPEGTEISLDNESQGDADAPSVDADGDGDIVVAWEREEPASDRGDIVSVRLRPDGTPIASAVRVNLDRDRNQQHPSVSSAKNGDFVVAWESEGEDDEAGVFGRLYQADGTAARTEILFVDSETSDGFGSPDVARDSVGNLTVVFDRKADNAPGDGVFARTTQLDGTTGCTAGADALCLDDQRFAIEVRWQVDDGGTGSGHPVPLTNDTGYFWFFDDANVELIVKVLDGTAFNGHYWVFYGALSNVEYWLTVTDTETGNTASYHNLPGTFASVGDTAALPGSTTTARVTVPTRQSLEDRAGNLSGTLSLHSDGCTANAQQLCLNQDRFAVQASWRDFDDASGQGQAVALTNDTGYFWFFNDANVELVVKVLDGRAVNGNFWVFYGSLSNVEYTITVTDTATDRVRTYVNNLGDFGSLGDTAAFPGD